MNKIKKATFQHVESELQHYHDTCKEIVRLKNDILYGGNSNPDENVGGGRSNLPGDPTGRTAVLMVSHRRIEQLERIVEAIESVVERLAPEKRKLVELKYWNGLLTWDGVALELHISRRQAFNWRDAIIYAITERLGWV